MKRVTLASAALGLGLAACGSCNKSETRVDAGDDAATPVVVEVLPRCRASGERAVVPGEDVVVGDVAVGKDDLWIGVVRVEGGRRTASLVRTSFDLAAPRVIDVGAALGDDPPPSPRVFRDSVYVAYYARRSSDAGARLRELDVARVDDGKVKVDATIVQQADESTAFDVAWNEAGTGLVAWDEDAPLAGDAGIPTGSGSFEGRGFVKVQAIGATTRRVASPESTDAETPRLVARPGGGFWLGWLARRVEDDERHSVEGPGEKRAFRWVEVVPLTATGDAAGPIRRITSEKGRAASFELARSGDDLVVLVQDEAAPSEGSGARIVRHVVRDKIESGDVLDGGVGTALAELVPAPGSGVRWLAWTDPAERAHMTPLGAGLTTLARTTAEPALDGARVVASAPPDRLYALVSGAPGEASARVELRKFACSAGEGTK